MAENIFNKVQIKAPDRSQFDLSYDHKLSMKMGNLVPVHIQECVPGDLMRVSTEALWRMAPMVSPIMHKVDITMHYFFVPNRIMWDNWERFITGGQKDSEPVAFPLMNTGAMNSNPGTLANYLGVPKGGPGDWMGSGVQVSALPFHAYQRIFFDYYRDQNLESPELYEFPKLSDGVQSIPETTQLGTMRQRAWGHDYFTSALPFAQKGDAVELPLDLQGTSTIAADYSTGNSGRIVSPSGGVVPNGANSPLELGNAGQPLTVSPAGGQPREPAVYDPNGTLQNTFDNVFTTTTINDLRTSFALQKWLEKNALGGSRYSETLKIHFNIKAQDARLNRPEYLGGVRSSMAISEVLQTSESADTPQANMAGHGYSVSGGRDFSYFVREHGFIVGIASILPKTAYQQGLPRFFSKTDRTLYAWPSFAFLGEQSILNQELYLDFDDNDYNLGTFGYIPRYSEYRYNPGRVSGQMQTTLNTWHMGRIFDAQPNLNSEFVKSNPTKRIFAVTDPAEDEIYAHIFFKIYANRPLPKYGTPGGLL